MSDTHDLIKRCDPSQDKFCVHCAHESKTYRKRFKYRATQNQLAKIEAIEKELREGKR